MTPANEQKPPADAGPVERELGLVPEREALQAREPDVFLLADKHGSRWQSPDEEGVSFEKSALLEFADSLQTAAYAEGRGDQYEEDCAAVRTLLNELDDADELSAGRINTTRVRELLLPALAAHRAAGR